MTRVLLLGASGMLGRDLVAAAPPGIDLRPQSHQDVDITDAAQVNRAVVSARPDIVINTACYTNVDGAEAEKDLAFRTNGAAPGLIGRAAAGVGALTVHFSSDYIFDGTQGRPIREDDAPAPLSVYGASKLEGERALAASGGKYLIIRTQWLFGLKGRSFPRTMWERARAGQSTKVVNDQFGHPTSSVDLARATWSVLGGAAPAGVLHIANRGVATWYDVARHVFERAGAADLVAPCTSAEFPRPARRPAWSALDTSRYEKLTGSSLPRWEDALTHFLGLLKGEPVHAH
ncbi:MAG: dTDP-4-dehydrorhamnose reductase [Gemmatimonadetes bacterium]|nr:dTDP-4-dehydrorhamnose reductase [Gemmatimonadota bacterium]